MGTQPTAALTYLRGPVDVKPMAASARVQIQVLRAPRCRVLLHHPANGPGWCVCHPDRATASSSGIGEALERYPSSHLRRDGCRGRLGPASPPARAELAVVLAVQWRGSDHPTLTIKHGRVPWRRRQAPKVRWT